MMRADERTDAVPEPGKNTGRDWVYFVITWGVGIAVPVVTVLGLALLASLTPRQHSNSSARTPSNRYHLVKPPSATFHECWTNGIRALSAQPCPPESMRRDLPAAGFQEMATPSVDLRTPNEVQPHR